MNNPKILVDRTALKMNRKRAVDSGGYFLHELAISEVKDRLININRDFFKRNKPYEKDRSINKSKLKFLSTIKFSIF